MRVALPALALPALRPEVVSGVLALLALLSVAAARAAPTSAIVGGLETSLLDEREPQGQPQQQPQQPPPPPQQQLLILDQDEEGSKLGRRLPTTAQLERVYSSGWHRHRPAAEPSRAPPLARLQPAAPAAAAAAAPQQQPPLAVAPRESYARTGNRLHVTPAEAGAQSGNPAPCNVAGRHFLHGQQVTRRDPCEFCVCLDGEVFCWWQDCPPSSAQGPCRGLPPFTACPEEPEEVAVNTPEGDVTPSNASAAVAVVTVYPSVSSSESTATSQQKDLATGSGSGTGSGTGSVLGADSSTLASSPLVQGSAPPSSPPSASPAPAPGALTGLEPTGKDTDAGSTTTVATSTELMCHVLGSSYRVGEVLPRDTGSCLQCECSPEGRVTCSPKDCLSVREEEDVYQPASSLDMFDVDSF